jgi:DNA polymerase-3 subunit beta
MAHQDVRYFLNGLLLELSDRIVRSVATDGHRLALCEVETDVPAESPQQVIVPRKGVSELLRLLQDSDDPVECRLGSNAIQLTLGNVRATSKLVDGRFPDYGRVMPEPGKNLLVIETRALRDALVRAAILSNEKYRGVRFELNAEELRVVAHNPEQEEAAEELPVDYDGDSIEIGFNVTYVIDALSALQSEQAHLWFRDGDSSCLIQESEDSRCRYVVMPMRL